MTQDTEISPAVIEISDFLNATRQYRKETADVITLDNYRWHIQAQGFQEPLDIDQSTIWIMLASNRVDEMTCQAVWAYYNDYKPCKTLAKPKHQGAA